MRRGIGQRRRHQPPALPHPRPPARLATPKALACSGPAPPHPTQQMKQVPLLMPLLTNNQSAPQRGTACGRTEPRRRRVCFSALSTPLRTSMWFFCQHPPHGTQDNSALYTLHC